MIRPPSRRGRGKRIVEGALERGPRRRPRAARRGEEIRAGSPGGRDPRRVDPVRARRSGRPAADSPQDSRRPGRPLRAPGDPRRTPAGCSRRGRSAAAAGLRPAPCRGARAHQAAASSSHSTRRRGPGGQQRRAHGGALRVALDRAPDDQERRRHEGRAPPDAGRRNRRVRRRPGSGGGTGIRRPRSVRRRSSLETTESTRSPYVRSARARSPSAWRTIASAGVWKRGCSFPRAGGNTPSSPIA